MWFSTVFLRPPIALLFNEPIDWQPLISHPEERHIHMYLYDHLRKTESLISRGPSALTRPSPCTIASASGAAYLTLAKRLRYLQEASCALR